MPQEQEVELVSEVAQMELEESFQPSLLVAPELHANTAPKLPAEPLLTPLLRKPIRRSELGTRQGKVIILLVGALGLQFALSLLIKNKIKNNQLALTITTTVVVAAIGTGLALMFCR